MHTIPAQKRILRIVRTIWQGRADRRPWPTSQQRHDVGLMSLKLCPQLGRQGTGRGTEPLIAAGRRDGRAAAAQFGEEVCCSHSTASSRSPTVESLTVTSA